MLVRPRSRVVVSKDFMLIHEHKVRCDAAHMVIEGTKATLSEFYLNTSVERAAVRCKDASVSQAHLWSMHALELVALGLGASTLKLRDATSTRLKPSGTCSSTS